MRSHLHSASVFVLGLAMGINAASAEMLTAVGDGEGQLNIVAWAGYIERGETDKKFGLGDQVRGGDELQGQREDRRRPPTKWSR